MKATLRVVTGATSLLLSGCASAWIWSRPSSSTSRVEAVVGRPEDVQWSATTLEAASTPAHRRVLQQAQAKTIVGEVVDVSCFLQLGKRGAAHSACGQQCVYNGQPVGLVTDAGELYVFIPEEHHPRRDGQATLKNRFAELMGKRVQVSGMVTQRRGVLALFVRTLPVVASTTP